jgi:topoisomerase-4 subunit A
MATVENMSSRFKAGKDFVTCHLGETLCAPCVVSGGAADANPKPATHVACVSTGGRILTFDMAELKHLSKGGRGLLLMALENPDRLAGAVAYVRGITIEGLGRAGKARTQTLDARSLHNARGARARKGKVVDLGFRPTKVSRADEGKAS